MELGLLRTIPLPASPRSVSVAAAAKAIAVSCEGCVFLFDETGGEIARWAVDRKARVDGIAVDPQATLVVLSTEAELVFCRVSDGSITAEPYGHWTKYSSGTCKFSLNGDLLWVVVPHEDPANPLMQVRDSTKRTLVDECQLLLDEQCGFGLTLHPNGTSGVIDAGAGQDGIWNFRFSLNKRGLTIEHLPELDWRPVNAIRSDGREFLTTSVMDACIERRAWRSQEVLVEVEDDNRFSASPLVYLDTARILVRAEEEEALGLIDSETLEVLELWEIDPGHSHHLGWDGTLVTCHRTARELRLWRLSG